MNGAGSRQRRTSDVICKFSGVGMNDLELLQLDPDEHEAIQVLRNAISTMVPNVSDNGIDLEKVWHRVNSLCILLVICTTLSNGIAKNRSHCKRARILLRSFLPRNFSEQTYFDNTPAAIVSAAMPKLVALNSRIAIAIRLTEAWLDEAVGFEENTISPEALFDSWRKGCHAAISAVDALLCLRTKTSLNFSNRTQGSTLGMLYDGMCGARACIDLHAQSHILGWAERSIEKRFNCDTIVVLLMRDRKLGGKIIDISRHVIQLECEGAVDVGEIAEIAFDGEARRAVVRWQCEGSIEASWLYPLPADHHLLESP
jgi:hypothetical protein